MSNDLYTAGEFESLLNESNVLDGVFECLRRIWEDESALTSRDFIDAEYQTRLLEHELSRIYPELYDDLKSQMGNHPVMNLDTGCGVIMDALSVREGFRLEQDLAADHDWDISFSWAPVEGLPSETTSICRRWFNAATPSQVSRDDYRFIGGREVPQLPTTDPAYVWTRHPDERLESAFKGNYSAEDIMDIYNGVKQLLEEIIHESTHSKFLVTSDHGYINHIGNTPYSLTDESEESLSTKFTSRHTPVANGQAYRVLEQEGIIDRAGDTYVVKGHYKWKKPGARKKVMHGGLSLPECMTPVLRINTDSTGGS